MKIIGITGGVGSGKSRVLSYLEEQHHAVICQADHVAWELQKPGKTGYLEIVARFGDGILNVDQTINRNVLGSIVFADAAARRKLNEIMHPAVKEAIRKRIMEEQTRGTKVFVVEAALLLEDHYDEICDELWFIYTETTIRRERLKESRGYSYEKIDGMMASQLSDDTFREECDVVIDNSGAFEETCRQIDKNMRN